MPYAVDQLFRRDAFLFGAQHDRRAVGVVGANIVAFVALHLLEAHPDVGLDVFDQVAEVDAAVGIGQSRRDQDFSFGHYFMDRLKCYKGADFSKSRARAPNWLKSRPCKLLEEQGTRYKVQGSRTKDFAFPSTFIFHLSPDFMSIKSDKWIRRMAQQHRMIEPFEPNQVKEVDGKRIVSYGTSSYGYDIRCSQRIQAVHQHQQHHRRSEELRPEFLRRGQGPTTASSRPTRSRWRAPSSISASRAAC